MSKPPPTSRSARLLALAERIAALDGQLLALMHEALNSADLGPRERLALKAKAGLVSARTAVTGLAEREAA